MLDLNSLSMITDGDESMISELIKTFVETTRDDIKQLESAINRHDIKDIAAFAHRIKGGAGIVGASQLHQLAENLERSPAQSFKENNTLFEEMKEVFHMIENSYPTF